MPIKNRLGELHAEITEWRRDIHANPEILFETHRTAALVAAKLNEFGCDEIVTGIGRTGVVGVIKGKTDTKGMVIGLRADMDALPIYEATGVDYASKTPGAMHACGHDGHTAMLLGAAKYMAETRNFDGTVVLIFQPAEEGGGGGKEMVDDGMLDRWNVQEVYGMHNMPGIPVGTIAVRHGAAFAAADQFEIHVEGKGGHAAMPHKTIDTTLVAAQIVVALQSIVSRNVDPIEQAVVSTCTFRTESEAHNVIPQHVLLKGTVRTLKAEIRDLVEANLIRVATATAEAYGAKATVNYHRGYPILINHDEPTDFAAEIAQKVTGKPAIHVPPTMGGEDFAYMLEERPGSYILLGNGDTPMVHHPEYNFDGEAIPYGSSWFAELVETRMPSA